MDTAHDFRILVAENAIARLEKILKQKGLPYPHRKEKALEILSKIRSNLMAVKYSFMPANLLLNYPPLKQIPKLALDFAKEVAPPKMFKPKDVKEKLLLSEVKYCLRVLAGLPSRIKLGDENRPENSIDILGVEVLSVMKHPKASNLKITKAGTEKEGFTIITNIINIRKGEIRAVALLPPIILFGEVSDAMYCSGPLTKEIKGKRPPSKLIHISEISSKVEEILRQK